MLTAPASVPVTDFQSALGRDGSPQPVPGYGLSLRLRFGGSLQEGLHFYLPQELSDRTLYIPGGETSASFSIQLIAPDQLPADASLSVELLSADSGYGVDPFHAVAAMVFSSSQPSVTSGGSRDQFQPFALVDQRAAAPMIYWANQDTPNIVLRGRSGVADSFLLGRPSFGLPHIENFQPSDGDVILIDSADFTDAERSPVITDFNAYAGLVFDLVQGSPLALISDYSIESGDLPWAGLSSSAGYYRFASPEEIAMSRNLTRDATDQPVFDSSSSEPTAPPRAPLPNPESGSESVDSPSVAFEPKVRRGGELQELVSPVGRSEIVALVSPGQLDVRPGELGFGTGGFDVLMAQPGTDQDQPLMLSGGPGSDTYVASSVGWTLVADVAGGRRDLLTGLTGRPSEWHWREVGGDGDLLLQRRHDGETARVLIFDPLGDNDKDYRIERVELAGRRKSLARFLDRAEQQRSFGFARLNQISDGSLGDLSDLRHRDSRRSLVNGLETNSASLQNLTAFG